MSVPSNAVYRNGSTPVTGDQYNTFLQGVVTVAALRQFVGVTNMQIALLGLTTAGDGGAGTFWWNPSSTAADDGVNIIVPPAAASGAWNRLAQTAVFSSGDFSGPPLIPSEGGYTLVNITTETVQYALPEFALVVNMTSSVGSGTLAPKTGIFALVDATAGSGPVSVIDSTLVLETGALTTGGIENTQILLNNNSGTDFGNNIDVAGLVQPAAIGLLLTGVSDNANSAAIAVTGTSVSQVGAWNAGVVFSGGVNRVAVLDESDAVYSYKIDGNHDYGIDTTAAVFADSAIRLGAQQALAIRNVADSADYQVLYTDGTNQLIFGTGVAAISFNNAVMLMPGLQASTSYADDAAAAVGGVGVGQAYRNGSVVQVRIT